MDFISIYNSYLPTKEEIKENYKSKGIYLDDAKCEDFILRKKLKASINSVNNINDLISIFNAQLEENGIGSIVFNELESLYCCYKFAQFNYIDLVINDNNQIGYLNEDGKFVLVFDEFNILIDFLIFYHKLEIEKFYRKTDLSIFINIVKDFKIKDRSNYLIKEIFYELGL